MKQRKKHSVLDSHAFLKIEEDMKKISKQEIRKVLAGNRFEMSGYDNADEGRNRNYGDRGSCVVHNTELLLRFAKYGIFEHTEYLYLDFYKGSPRIHFKYWNEKLGEEFLLEHKNYNLMTNIGRIQDGLDGWTTSTIIEKIFDLTIYSDKPTRRTQQ